MTKIVDCQEEFASGGCMERNFAPAETYAEYLQLLKNRSLNMIRNSDDARAIVTRVLKFSSFVTEAELESFLASLVFSDTGEFCGCEYGVVGEKVPINAMFEFLRWTGKPPHRIWPDSKWETTISCVYAKGYFCGRFRAD